MFWKTRDGKIHEPADLALVLTLDFHVVMMLSDEAAEEYRNRDNFIELGMKKAWNRHALDLRVLKTIETKWAEIGTKHMYEFIGLWIAGLLDPDDQDSHNHKKSSKQCTECTDEEDEDEGPPPPPEPEPVVEKKRRQYIR